MIGRRTLLTQAAAGLCVSFALPARGWGQSNDGAGGAAAVAPGLPGSLSTQPMLDAWIRIDPDGTATVFTGKAELGQGIRTALFQIAVDELDMMHAQVRIVTADTARSPDEGLTAGSHSIDESGTAIALAAANVRFLLASEAARRWGVPVEATGTRAGMVYAPDGRTLGYGPLAAALSLTVPARADIPRKRRSGRRMIGRPVPRIDIPDKLTGVRAYVHDMTLPGMLHARVIRGPSEGTRRTGVDWAAVAAMPGVTRIVRQGGFAAIVGPREWPLMTALRRIGRGRWERIGAPLPPGPIDAVLRAAPAEIITIADRRGAAGAPVRRLRARYTRPFLLHGSIGPSCAVALLRDGVLTVWTHTQGVGPLRTAIAGLVGLPPERVRCIHREGAGCYGHNGADDAAGDAALIAVAMPGTPIKLLWTREDEHGWEPLGTAMTVDLEGGIDAAGRIAAWSHRVWSPPHLTRPKQAGDLLAGVEIGGFASSTPRPNPQPEGSGDRNAIPLYAIPDLTVAHHFLAAAPLRVSALRALGAHHNIFAIESFIDELAALGARDPVAFRLAHLDDVRARDVIRRAARLFGWPGVRGRNRGAGFAFARYKNLAGYCALAIDIERVPETGRLIVHRVVAVVDAGEAVNPDGIRNQVEGGIVQSLSWSMTERMPYHAQRRTAHDWSGYPIHRFDDVPRRIDVEVIDRPGMPFLGVGEVAQGPAAAALANAIAAAGGGRRRAMPLQPG